jgi:hypothetical protein
MTLLDDTCDMTLWDAIQSGDVRAVAKQLHSSSEPQQPRNRESFAPVEGSSPTDDAGTAGVVSSDYDGAPFCSHCGARAAQWCDCGPIAENE